MQEVSVAEVNRFHALIKLIDTSNYSGLQVFLQQDDPLLNFKYVLTGKFLLIKNNHESGRTIFHYAVESPGITEKILALLISKGMQSQPDDLGRIPLHYAVLAKNVKAVKFLIPNTNVNSVDLVGNTALYIAAEMGVKSIVEQLIKAGAKDIPNYGNYSALHVIAESGNIHLLPLFFTPGNAIDVVAEHNLTPLHLAVYNGHAELVEYFLEQGADPNKITEFEYEIIGGVIDTYNYADNELIQTTHKNNTPLHLAVIGKFSGDLLNQDTEHARCIQLLLKYGGNLELTNSAGLSVKALASQEVFKKNENVIRKLLKALEPKKQECLITTEKKKKKKKSRIKNKVRSKQNCLVDGVSSNDAAVLNLYGQYGFSKFPAEIDLQKIPKNFLHIINLLLKNTIDVYLYDVTAHQLIFSKQLSTHNKCLAVAEEVIIQRIFDDNGISYTLNDAEIVVDSGFMRWEFMRITSCNKQETLQMLKKISQDCFFSVYDIYIKFNLEIEKLHYAIICPTKIIENLINKTCSIKSNIPRNFFNGKHELVFEMLCTLKDFSLDDVNDKNDLYYQMSLAAKNLQITLFLIKEHATFIADKLQQYLAPEQIADDIKLLKYCGVLDWFTLSESPVVTKRFPLNLEEFSGAIEANDYNTVRRLLANGDINDVNQLMKGKFTALDLAISAGNMQIIGLLLLAGANVTNLYDCGKEYIARTSTHFQPPDKLEPQSLSKEEKKFFYSLMNH